MDTDNASVEEILAVSAEIESVSYIATFGALKVFENMPPMMIVARAPTFDPTGIAATSSSNEYRFGVMRHVHELWATLEFWWPNGQERIFRVNLAKSSRNLFPILAEIASEFGIAEFGVSPDKGGIPKQGIIGLQLDLSGDEMFADINKLIKDLPDWLVAENP